MTKPFIFRSTLALLTLAMMATALVIAVSAGTSRTSPANAETAPAAPSAAPDSSPRADAVAQAAAQPEGPLLAGADLTAFVTDYSRKIPLPPGGNFNGINWNAQFTPAQVANQLEYNAACQWIRATAAGVKGAGGIVGVASKWPSFRTGQGLQADEQTFFRSAAQTVDNRDQLRTMAQGCYGLQDQIVKQAAVQGQAPPAG